MAGVTSDPAAAAFLAKTRPAPPGEIKQSIPGKTALALGDKVIFEATMIGSWTAAQDGTILVEAVTGKLPPTHLAEVLPDGTLKSSPRQVWIVAPSGNKRQLSPDTMDATAPLISADGKSLAFTGRLLDPRGLPGPQQLYCYNSITAKYEVYGSVEHKHDYKVVAVEWAAENKLLKILEDWGETGGHLVLKEIKYP